MFILINKLRANTGHTYYNIKIEFRKMLGEAFLCKNGILEYFAFGSHSPNSVFIFLLMTRIK